jgi:hypothetical protein
MREISSNGAVASPLFFSFISLEEEEEVAVAAAASVEDCLIDSLKLRLLSAIAAVAAEAEDRTFQSKECCCVNDDFLSSSDVELVDFLSSSLRSETL